MIAFAILLTAMLVDQPMPKVMVCTPAGVKKPPLMMADSKGKCQQGYKAVEDGNGKEKKTMYCVNTEKPKPAECKESTIQPPSNKK